MMARLHPAFTTGARVGAGSGAVAPLKVAPVAFNRVPRSAVTTKAFLGGLFGGKKEEAAADGKPAYMVCIDCGYILSQADFKKAPGSYKCPACNSPKSRFKLYKGTDVKGKPNNTGAAMQKRMKEKKW